MEASNSAVFEEIISNSKCYLFFGGIAGRLVIPPYEFFKSAKILDESKIFFRDLYQTWYQCGIPEIATDVYELSSFIKKKMDLIKPEKIIFVGNSMGGFAAILFSSLLNYNNSKAIAFSPQTFISPFKRLKYGDHRWQKMMLRTYKKSILKKHVYDLSEVLNDKVNVEVFLSKKNRLDYIHAKNIKCFNNVTINHYDIEGHNIVKKLRDEGKLPSILKK